MKKITLLLLLLLSNIICNSQIIKITEAQNEWFKKLNESDQRRIKDAIALTNKVEEIGNYISNITDIFTEQQIPLPIGYKNSSGYRISISDFVKENDSIVSITLTCIIPFKTNILGLQGIVKVNANSGFSTPSFIEMIVPIYFGKKFKIVFNPGTKAELDCEGISNFHVNYDLIMDTTSLVCYNENDSIINDFPKINSEIDFKSIEDFTLNINQKLKFGFKKIEDWIFEFERIDFDNSETVTNNNIQFPENYFTQNVEKNLWKGFSIQNAKLLLPKKFSKDTLTRKIINCEYFIVDDNGFTILAEAQNFGRDLDKSKTFDIDVDNTRFHLFKNKIEDVMFEGHFNWNTLGRFSFHDYFAEYNDANNQFEINTNLGDSLVLDFFKAELKLNADSELKLKIKNGNFVPSILANGNLTINVGENNSNLHIPQLDFQNLYLGLEKPYFNPGIWEMEGTASAKFANMELQINKLQFTNELLQINANMEFGNIITAGAGFDIYTDFSKFKFKSFKINSLTLGYTSETFSLKGSATFEKNDPVYGNYFKGDVNLEILKMFNIDAVGLFGKVSDNKYFFADFKAGAGGKTLFVIPPKFDVYEIGGGLYRHMKQSSSGTETGKSMSEIYYIPDTNVGLGFTAMMNFGIVNKNICDVSTRFDIQFNNHFGLNFAQFKGDAVFFDGNKKFDDITSSLNNSINRYPQTSKPGDKKDLIKPSLQGKYPMTASLLIKYDNTDKTFFSDLRAYLDLGIIYGKGVDKKLIDATAYFGNKDWYVHVGTPDDRCGIVVDTKIFKLDVNSYFMLGKVIPKFDLPQKIIKMMPESQYQKYLSRNTPLEVSDGRGVAFGVAFETEVSAKVFPFYAEIGAGAGSEFLLTNYGKHTHCQGQSGSIGINGWYASAELWAYLEASIGIEVRFFGHHKFNILKGGAFAVLNGNGPNPFYFNGNVGCYYNVMHGLFKGKCNIDFEIGEKCKIVKDKELLDIPIIQGTTPQNGDDTVNVFASPQLLLNIACNETMNIDFDGEKGNYKVKIDYIKVAKFVNNQEMNGSQTVSDDGLVVTFDPDEPFESKTKYKLTAQVSFMKYVNGQWQIAKDLDNNEYIEKIETIFTSGERPQYIMPEHIICSYPKNRMYNFYPNETNTGYFCISENYRYLFSEEIPEGYIQKVRISTLKGESQDIDFTHFASKEVANQKYELNFDLSKLKFSNQEIYKLQILNIPEHIAELNENVKTDYTANNGDSIRNISADGNFAQLETKQICAVDFRVSKYNSLKEKVDDIGLEGQAKITGLDIYMKNIEYPFINEDFFDVYEQQERNLTQTLVGLNANLEATNWFKSSIYYEMYHKYSETEIKRNRAFSYPPSDAMTVFNPLSINHDYLTDYEINTGVAQGIYNDGCITYNVIFDCYEDYRILQNIIVNKYYKGEKLTEYETKVLKNDLPEQYTKGDYPYTISYRLPGKNIITSEIHKVLIYK